MRVSAVLPVFNRADLVIEAIDSIRAQSLTDWELVVVDDASTDGTADAVANHLAADDRMRLIRLEQNVGSAEARNVGIRASSGPLIATHDSDDLWRPPHLERAVAFLDANPDVDVVGCDADMMNLQGQVIETWSRARTPAEVRFSMLFSCQFAHPSTVMRRSAITSVGLYDPRMRKYDDLDLWLRLRAAGVQMANIPEVNVSCRLTANSIMRSGDPCPFWLRDLDMMAAALAEEIGWAFSFDACRKVVALRHGRTDFGLVDEGTHKVIHVAAEACYGAGSERATTAARVLIEQLKGARVQVELTLANRLLRVIKDPGALAEGIGRRLTVLRDRLPGVSRHDRSGSGDSAI